MSAILGAAALTAGAGMFGSMLGAGSQAATNRANLKLAKYQFDQNKEMWHMQNEYNRPDQQMDRLRAAGLNPNLVYGHGAVGNTTSNAPSYEAPKLQAYTGFSDDFRNSVAQAFTVQNLDAQNSNIRAQNEVIGTQAALLKEKAIGQAIQNKAMSLDYGIKEFTRSSEIQRLQNNAKLSEVQRQYVEKQIVNLDADIVIKNVEKDLKRQQIKINEADYKKIRAMTNILVAQLPQEQKKAELMNLGININDPIYMRVAGQIATGLGATTDTVVDWINDGISAVKSWFK